MRWLYLQECPPGSGQVRFDVMQEWLVAVPYGHLTHYSKSVQAFSVSVMNSFQLSRVTLNCFLPRDDPLLSSLAER